MASKGMSFSILPTKCYIHEGALKRALRQKFPEFETELSSIERCQLCEITMNGFKLHQKVYIEINNKTLEVNPKNYASEEMLQFITTHKNIRIETIYNSFYTLPYSDQTMLYLRMLNCSSNIKFETSLEEGFLMYRIELKDPDIETHFSLTL